MHKTRLEKLSFQFSDFVGALFYYAVNANKAPKARSLINLNIKGCGCMCDRMNCCVSFTRCTQITNFALEINAFVGNVRKMEGFSGACSGANVKRHLSCCG